MTIQNRQHQQYYRAAVIGISLMLGFIVAMRSVFAQSEPDLSQLVTLRYNLLDGWNLVSFPQKPIAFTTAAGLIRDIVDNGGFVTSVATWDGDRWQVFTHQGANQYGQDFSIESTKAYFIRSHENYSWETYATPLVSLPTRELTAGWNAVGLAGFDGQTAENILDTLSDGRDRAHEIDFWNSGAWEVFVKRTYSPENIQVYGNNFTIDVTKGYMVRLTAPASLEVEQ